MKSRMFLTIKSRALSTCSVADLCNHSPLAPVAYSFGSDAFELYAYQPLEPGSAVDISYGYNLDNSSLLANYGFCLLDNPHERILLSNKYHLGLTAPSYEAMTALGYGSGDSMIPSPPCLRRRPRRREASRTCRSLKQTCGASALTSRRRGGTF